MFKPPGTHFELLRSRARSVLATAHSISGDHIQMSTVPCQQVSSTSHASSQHCLGTLEEMPLILMLIYSAPQWGMIRAQCVGEANTCCSRLSPRALQWKPLHSPIVPQVLTRSPAGHSLPPPWARVGSTRKDVYSNKQGKSASKQTVYFSFPW